MAWKCVYSSHCHYGKKSIYFIKQHMKYTFSRIKKRKSLREIFVYHLLFNICFCSCKFIIHNRNTRLRYSTWEHDELISHSKYIIGSDGNVNIAEFLRPPVSKNICERLLLSDVILTQSISSNLAFAQPILLKFLFQNENIQIISKIVNFKIIKIIIIIIIIIIT